MKIKHAAYRKKARKIVICLVCLSVFLFVAEAEKNAFALNTITINISDNIKINRDQITLGMISEIVTDDMQALDKLEDIFITAAPDPGKSLNIHSNYIRTRLKQNRISLKRVKLNAPSEILVTRNFIKITEPMIENAVRAYLVKNMPWDTKNTKIKKVSVSQDVTLPPGELTYQVESTGRLHYSGRMSMPVNFYINGKLNKKIWVTVTLEVTKEVVVAKKHLGRFQPITQDDIELKKIDISRLPSNVILTCENLFGKRTKRKINAGTVLREDFIELPPLIKPGDRVKVIAESSGLRITAFGVAKKRGRKGEKIMVVNLDSKKWINAKVIDANTVRVDF